MIRRVAFRKAIAGGLAGAVAWELVVRLLRFSGVPLGDLVHLLGTMLVGRAPAWLWWPTGMTLHLGVGAVWAIFYAYFFWSTFAWRPGFGDSHHHDREVDDPNFEEHLREGPYVVFDDSAKPKYRDDPRVHFVPGHPVLRTAMPELLKGLGVKLPANLAQRWQQFERRGMHELQYGSRSRRMQVVGSPLVLASLLAGGAFALRRWIQRRSTMQR
ncbi:MAG: hypothetical protein ACJ8AP_15290 [Gemmatimonadales bacterium]